jgi:hypothetical protein
MQLRPWILSLLLVLDGMLAVALADRAATLRSAWAVWEMRVDAQARLKQPEIEDARSHRPRRQGRPPEASPEAAP